MTKKDTENYKKKLLEEKKRLETELSDVGQKNPSTAQGWEATSGNIQVDTADENELADKLEEYEGNSGILTRLDEQLKEVEAALLRITSGTYGICEVCGKPIEMERLEANPSARFSLKHGHPSHK